MITPTTAEERLKWALSVLRQGNAGADVSRDADVACDAIRALPRLIADVERLTAECDEARRAQVKAVLDEVWIDGKDEHDEAIRAAFPTRSGKHEQYAQAMKMVGCRRSKGSLVALVTWLLVERDEALEALASLKHGRTVSCVKCGTAVVDYSKNGT